MPNEVGTACRPDSSLNLPLESRGGSQHLRRPFHQHTNSSKRIAVATRDLYIIATETVCSLTALPGIEFPVRVAPFNHTMDRIITLDKILDSCLNDTSIILVILIVILPTIWNACQVGMIEVSLL